MNIGFIIFCNLWISGGTSFHPLYCSFPVLDSWLQGLEKSKARDTTL